MKKLVFRRSSPGNVAWSSLWSFPLYISWRIHFILIWIHSSDRLFQFIQGANLNSSRIPMTAPVLTSIVPGAGPLHSSAYFVRFYLPVKFQANPPVPLPELDLKPDKWPVHCVAVRKFSGFARDDNIVKEAEKLATSLNRSPWANFTTSESSYAYSIAQYSSPFQIFGRVNEIWVDVESSELDDCVLSNTVSTSWNTTACWQEQHSKYVIIYTRRKLNRPRLSCLCLCRGVIESSYSWAIWIRIVECSNSS